MHQSDIRICCLRQKMLPNGKCNDYIQEDLDKYNLILGISLIGFVLTIAVYLYVEKLRNVLGKCLICCIFCRLVLFALMILDDLSLLNDFSSSAGYSAYFFKIASYFWDTVISFHLWKTLTSLATDEPRFRFLKFSAFVWGIAAIPTGVIYYLNRINSGDFDKWVQMHSVTLHECYVTVWKFYTWTFNGAPILILGSFNVTMFTLTVIYIRKVKSQLKKFTPDDDRTTGCFNFSSQNYLLFLRLSVVMGISWILNAITFGPHYDLWGQVFRIVDYIHGSMGVIIFALLILKRSTIELIKKR
ncbi:probable G-protein coupled receptor Mth-like 7 [Drosophila rhopaloa]|uniref:G-protein coupled receptors family 2 profile 2 domain-containing protein n=1 Tax=Drosophila rhopaloa TaxID=1041015 RepID=A0ABM5J944_DRORH|nr:probable G-protein coupled receptor Mth-like 7 [Drosophila rhopaloa]